MLSTLTQKVIVIFRDSLIDLLAQSQVRPLGASLGGKRERTPVSGRKSIVGISI